MLLLLVLFFNTQNINRVLLGNERATAKLLFNVMKSELEKDKLHQLKWQERVKVWKLIQKNCIVQSFREFTASEEIQNPPTVKTEMENMIKEQIVLSDQRLRVLQHIGTLLPPKHTQSDIINEWYRTLENLNRSIDTPNVECMEKMCIQYELVQDKCQEKVQVCKSEFKEMAKWHEQHCEGLYNYVQDAMALWDVHQLQLSQQENVLQKKVDECRWEEDNIIQMMEDNLDTSLEKMKMASCEEELKQYLEKALSSLDQIRTRARSKDIPAQSRAGQWPLSTGARR
uniref:Coiled-coil domain-containing protein 180-like n=1 Tax=Cyanistes caeruleus TaxID=156563 RepID=A0A8C0U4K0_CYACU